MQRESRGRGHLRRELLRFGVPLHHMNTRAFKPFDSHAPRAFVKRRRIGSRGRVLVGSFITSYWVGRVLHNFVLHVVPQLLEIVCILPPWPLDAISTDHNE